MRAAVANGADAVYFGLSKFNARHRATNFTLDELHKVMDYLHGHNVRGYVTFDTLVFSDELPEALRFVRAVAGAGADAVIVQDLGIARLIGRMCPNRHVHGSTQMTLTEPLGIEFVKTLGVKRVILARELSLAEIRWITAQTDVPVEVFVHGALCVAYSGQCLTSESLGQRSANRGQCAQACRLPYEHMNWWSMVKLATWATRPTCSARRTWPRTTWRANLPTLAFAASRSRGD
ncbi:MAG TPA: peptidase U32 family protein [Tepidisphaeraceae bacterium]|jgi:putative protease